MKLLLSQTDDLGARAFDELGERRHVIVVVMRQDDAIEREPPEP